MGWGRLSPGNRKTMRQVNHHAAVAIVFSEGSDEFLFDCYDDSYPMIDWRGRVNLIGGNLSETDLSPRGIWEREVEEEFCSHELPEGLALSLRDRQAIAEDLVTHAKPFKDYVVWIPSLRFFSEKGVHWRQPLIVLHSVFKTFLSRDCFEKVRDSLKKGKGIKNEGRSAIASLKDLQSGKIVAASATAPILSDSLGLEGEEALPNPDGVLLETVGMPKNKLKEYGSDFEYTRPFIPYPQAYETL